MNELLDNNHLIKIYELLKNLGGGKSWFIKTKCKMRGQKNLYEYIHYTFAKTMMYPEFSMCSSAFSKNTRGHRTIHFRA